MDPYPQPVVAHSAYSFATSSEDRSGAAHGSVIDQTDSRIDAELGALQDRIALLAERVAPVLRMHMPEPEAAREELSEVLVGDHNSTVAQAQQTRCYRVASMTSQINDLLTRLEL